MMSCKWMNFNSEVKVWPGPVLGGTRYRVDALCLQCHALVYSTQLRVQSCDIIDLQLDGASDRAR